MLRKERVKEGGLACHHRWQELRERGHTGDFHQDQAHWLCGSKILHLDLLIMSCSVHPILSL